jgi:hypothetical protein
MNASRILQTAEKLAVLKGRGFSRAVERSIQIPALAAEGMQIVENYIPSGAKAQIPLVPGCWRG